MINLSDELLMAYVDGQLDKPQAAVVGGMLRDDQELAYRVSRLQQTQAQLLDTFGALLREGVSLNPKSPRPRRSISAGSFVGNPVLTLGTAGLLFLIGASVGVTGGYYSGLFPGKTKELVQLPPTNWPGDIAEFHSYFTREAMRVSPASQANPDMVKFQLAQISNAAILPDFSSQGLKFARGQMLSYRGNKVMQLAYLGGKNDPLIALYISAGGLDMPMSPGQFGDVNTISWSAKELRFVIAGEMPHQALRALAVVALAQLSKK